VSETLVVGGTGLIGKELVSLLISAAIKPRILFRQNSRALLPAPEKATVVRGDLADKKSLEAALENVGQVFLLSRDNPRQGELEGNLISVAQRAGVKKIVKSSAYAAALDPPLGYGLAHAVSEQTLMDSKMDWVILRPYMFMQNFLDVASLIKTRSLIPMPLGEANVSLIDARDVALAAKTVLTETGHEGRIYELTGPESLSVVDCAKTLSEVLGRSIRYRSPPYWVAAMMMRLQGVSAWDIRMRKALFQMIRDNGEDATTGDLESIIARKARNFKTFTHDHLEVFQ
jgi:uncharacterized protein YbjT (DUF2867 family)